MSGESGEPNAQPDLGEVRPDDADEPFAYISNEHPYQRILRWCGPYVSNARRSIADSSPYVMLAWAAGLAGILQFGSVFGSFAHVEDPWFVGTALVGQVPIALVIALALARARHPVAVLIVRITATVLLAGAVVIAGWTAVRFVNQPDRFDGAGYPLLFPLAVLNLIAIPFALWALAFRR